MKKPNPYIVRLTPAQQEVAIMSYPGRSRTEALMLYAREFVKYQREKAQEERFARSRYSKKLLATIARQSAELKRLRKIQRKALARKKRKR